MCEPTQWESWQPVSLYYNNKKEVTTITIYNYITYFNFFCRKVLQFDPMTSSRAALVYINCYTHAIYACKKNGFKYENYKLGGDHKKI